MMERKLAILAVAVAVVSCGQRKDSAFHPRPFPQVSVPAMVTDPAEAASYYAEHFWDGFTDTSRLYFCDSAIVNGVRTADVEQAYANYLAFLDIVYLDEAVKSVGNLFAQVSAVEKKDTSSNVFEEITRLTQLYLYDPNSPYRNEDLYFPFVSGLSRSRFVPESSKTAYGYDARMCSLNRVGTRAADFVFSDKDGKSYSLYGIEAEYTILFFSNPGCAACKEIIDALNADERVRKSISDGTLAVLNIYIDEDLAGWYKYMPVYPDDWYNGYDPNLVIRNDVLYNVRAIPSLYLLDRDKVVMMKDAPQEKLFYWLDRQGSDNGEKQ